MNYRYRRWWQIAAVVLAIMMVVLVLAMANDKGDSAALDTSPSYEGAELDGVAPDFRLVDHKGVRLALSDFRGQVVVLTFLDSQCQETCPLTATHLRMVSQTLSDDVSSVVFMGVNVNLEANTVADVLAATKKWRLDEIPTWHFLTGSAEELEPVWQAYNIMVIPEQDEIQHTPGVFLIDPAGQQRWYVSTPFDETGQPQWTAPLNELLVKHIRELLSQGWQQRPNPAAPQVMVAVLTDSAVWPSSDGATTRRAAGAGG
ncbi:MAG: hypothetical protein BroJett011_08200 [Chloroflexota bacterium]|nr:MAG: hypothetical protein BroJett011_08200 [Chloroflexota bacterium]